MVRTSKSVVSARPRGKSNKGSGMNDNRALSCKYAHVERKICGTGSDFASLCPFFTTPVTHVPIRPTSCGPPVSLQEGAAVMRPTSSLQQSILTGPPPGCSRTVTGAGEREGHRSPDHGLRNCSASLGDCPRLHGKNEPARLHPPRAKNEGKLLSTTHCTCCCSGKWLLV